MGKHKKVSPEEMRRALIMQAISTRCYSGMMLRLRAGETEGETHCGFRIEPSVFLGKVTWKRDSKDRLHLTMQAFELSPQTGQLEECYNIKLEDDYTEE